MRKDPFVTEHIRDFNSLADQNIHTDTKRGAYREKKDRSGRKPVTCGQFGAVLGWFTFLSNYSCYGSIIAFNLKSSCNLFINNLSFIYSVFNAACTSVPAVDNQPYLLLWEDI